MKERTCIRKQALTNTIKRNMDIIDVGKEKRRAKEEKSEEEKKKEKERKKVRKK